MFIEKIGNEDYIITNQKTDKGQEIVIKLNTEIKNEIACVTGSYSKIIELSWELKGDDISNLYIQINTEIIDKKLSSTVKVDSEKFIKELIDAVKKNGTIDECSELNKALYLSYNKLFKTCLKERLILMSDFVTEGIVKLKESNKILGNGSRFILNNHKLTVCEYTGKEITKFTLPKIEIHIDQYKIIFNCSNALNDSDERVIFSSEDDIGYVQFAGRISHLEDTDEKMIEYPTLNIPYYFSTEKDMKRQIKQNNTLDDIIKYKIAFKGKVEILDINKYMVNEFLI